MTADLITRLESADGPDRELDADIHESIGNIVDRGCPITWHYEDETPRYTASIDAALTLVPEGWHMSVNTTVGALLQGSAAVRDRDGGPSFASAAATPALALAAAALKARGV